MRNGLRARSGAITRYALYRITRVCSGRTMTQLKRRDPDMDTNWTLEHLLKDLDDLKAYLQLPDEVLDRGEPDVSNIVQSEEQVGERGIVMIDTPDPLCLGESLTISRGSTLCQKGKICPISLFSYRRKESFRCFVFFFESATRPDCFTDHCIAECSDLVDKKYSVIVVARSLDTVSDVFLNKEQFKNPGGRADAHIQDDEHQR